VNAEQDDEDRRLVRLHLAGDSAGFESLYRLHRERIFAVAMRMLRNREDALDTTQEVFVRIHKALDGFDPSGRFLTWAYRITTNHCIDRIRRRKVRREQAVFEDSVGEKRDLRTGRSGTSKPETKLEREEISRAVSDAVDQLGEAHRMVFTLYCYEGLSYGEIAAVMGIPVGTVMSRLFHARKKVKESLPADWDPGGPRRGKSPAEGGDR
jgi:RNA polymerase sigma-70 factor (ECF subfamily)